MAPVNNKYYESIDGILPDLNDLGTNKYNLKYRLLIDQKTVDY